MRGDCATFRERTYWGMLQHQMLYKTLNKFPYKPFIMEMQFNLFGGKDKNLEIGQLYKNLEQDYLDKNRST